jgi:GT2 family glycosyltransferase
LEAPAQGPAPRPEERSAWLDSFLENGPIDVSVCIANWNCRELLRACLVSLHDQPQGTRLETIVVDNASDDGSAEMVAREFPEVVLVRNRDNLGFARANNQAAARARGRYLFFLNNDTLVPTKSLGRLVAFAEANPHVGLVGPRLRDSRGQPQVSYRQRPTVTALLHRTHLLRWTGLLRTSYRRYRRLDFDPEAQRSVEVLMGAAMFLRRDVFYRCGGWDEDFLFGGEDIDLSIRVGRRFPIVYLPSVEITHYGRVSTRQNVRFTSPNIAAGFVRYLRKAGCPRLGLLCYKLVVTLDAPVGLAAKALQYLRRHLRGRPDRAARSRLALKGQWEFLTKGLRPFWRA